MFKDSSWPTRWVAASGECTGTPFLLSYLLDPRTLGWKTEHDRHNTAQFKSTSQFRVEKQVKEFFGLCIIPLQISIGFQCTVPGDMGFVSTGLSPSLEMRMQERKGVKTKNCACVCWLKACKRGDAFFAHSVLGAIELLSLLSRPPKKPLTSFLDVFLRRRSAASFFPDNQELALLRYESRPAGGAARSSSSEGDGWDLPEREDSRAFYLI